MKYVVFFAMAIAPVGGWSQVEWSEIDSLKEVLLQRQDTHAILACYQLGKLYAPTDLDSSYHYLHSGAVRANALKFLRGKILLWRSLGSIEARRGNHQESLHWIHKGLTLITKENLPIINRVDYLINLGATYYYRHDVGKALEPYLEAMEICRRHGFDAKRSMLLNNLGIFYRMLERYDDALEIYEDALSFRSSNKDTMGMANVMFNMATTYRNLDRHDDALVNLEQARLFFTALNSEPDVMLCDLPLGNTLIELGRMDEALPILTNLDQQKDLPFEPNHQALLQLSLARLYLHFGRYLDAQKHLDKIKASLFPSDFIDHQITWYDLSASAAEGSGNSIGANRHLRSIIAKSREKDSLQSMSLRKEMETKYLSQEKDHEIDLLEDREKITQLQLKTIKQRNIGLVAGVLILLLTAFLLARINKKIKSQHKLIVAADQEKGLLLREIHHRVKNNLQVVSSLLSLQSKYLSDQNAVEALKVSKNRVHSMALIHRDLYQHDHLGGVNTRVYFDKMLNNLLLSYQIQQELIALQTDIEDIWLDVDTMIPLGLVVNELISNALKHAFSEGKHGLIHFHLSEHNDILSVIVKDNGRGMEAEKEERNFGRSLIQAFAKKLDAQVYTENAQGYSVTLQIKKYEKLPQSATTNKL